MAGDPPPTPPDANDLRKEDGNHIHQGNINNDKGNVAGVNNGTLIGAQYNLTVAIESADDLAIILNHFAPKVPTSQKLLALAVKIRGISKILTDIRKLIQVEAREENAVDKAKDGHHRGHGKDGDDAKVVKLPGFAKLMEACDQCSAVFKDISREINQANAKNILEERIHLLGLQIDEQQFSLQINLQLFQIYVDKDNSNTMKKLLFELAIGLRAVVTRLMEAQKFRLEPPYIENGLPPEIHGTRPAPKPPVNLPNLSHLVPLYMGWTIRRAKRSDLPPNSGLAFSHDFPSWTRIVRTPMPFSSEELFLKILTQESRRSKKNRTLQDEYNDLRSKDQKRQVDRLIRDQNESLPEGLEWKLAGLESMVRNVGFWRKETRRVKIILKTQWAPPGVSGGGGNWGGMGGGNRLGGRNDGGGGARFYPHENPEPPHGGRGGGVPFGAYHDGEDFRGREYDFERTHPRRSHNRRHQYSPPPPPPRPHSPIYRERYRHPEHIVHTPGPSNRPPTTLHVPQGIRTPRPPGFIIEDPSYLPPPPGPGHNNHHQPGPLPPNIRIPASQRHTYMPPPPPPPTYMTTPYMPHPGVLHFESHESALQRVRAEVTRQQEKLVVGSLLAEWEPAKEDRKEKRRESARMSNGGTSYGRDWALGRDIRRTDSDPGRQYRPELAYRYGPSHLSRQEFHPRSNFISRPNLYSERDRYRLSDSSDTNLGIGYFSQSDDDGDRARRRRVRKHRRDSRHPIERARHRPPSPRPMIIERAVPRESYDGDDLYVERQSPRYEERRVQERHRRAREREDVDFMERPHIERTFPIFNEAHPFAPSPRGYPSGTESSEDEIDEHIVVTREGGVRRSGNMSGL